MKIVEITNGRRNKNKNKAGGANSGNGPAVVRGPRRRGRGQGGQAPRGLPVAEYLNPFSDVVGKKFPDQNAAPSIPFRMRQVATMGVNSDGSLGCAIIIPRANSQLYTAPTYTAGTPTVFPITALGTPTVPAVYTAFEAAMTAYRCIAFGVRITSVGAPLEAQGWLTLITVPTNGSDIADLATSPNDLGIQKDVIPIQPGMDVVWFSRPLSHEVMSYRAENSTSVQLDRTSLCAFYEGATSGVLLRLEIVADFECLPQSRNFTQRLCTPAAPCDFSALQKIEHAASHIRTVSNITEQSLRYNPWGINMGTLLNTVAAIAAPAAATGGALAWRAIKQNTRAFVQFSDPSMV